MSEETILKKKVNKIKGRMLTGKEEIKTYQNNKISLMKEEKLRILISEEGRMRHLYYVYYDGEQDLPLLLIITITSKKKVLLELLYEKVDCSYIRGSLFIRLKNIIKMNFID